MNPPPLPLDITEEADADIEEIGFYYALKSRELEERFYRAFDKTVRLLASFPELGEHCQFRNPKTEGMRVWRVSDFPNHLIFYRPQGDELHILRVLHGAMDYNTLYNEE